ncbi:MAG: CPBP family intramembrane metalloprotease [Planctomycetaceae bacterium]|nr:CPBP family intramembrane metalloprotease [Planctomycetaceae bacterium]
MGRRVYLLVEFLILFVGVPAAMTELPRRGLLLVTLGVFALGCLVLVLRDREFDRRQLWRGSAVGPAIGALMLRFVGLAAVLGGVTWVFAPDRLFGFVRAKPEVWAIVMVAYPVLSVYPQELVYRAFMFQRYRALFDARWFMIVMSGLAFSWMHIVFLNWQAPALTLIGGLLFAWTYDRTRSLAAASIEHALFGCFVFTIGLGAYFYHGTAASVEQAAEVIRQVGQ